MHPPRLPMQTWPAYDQLSPIAFTSENDGPPYSFSFFPYHQQDKDVFRKQSVTPHTHQ
jgi:hypothetical protein